jgi:hypothetical protein
VLTEPKKNASGLLAENEVAAVAHVDAVGPLQVLVPSGELNRELVTLAAGHVAPALPSGLASTRRPTCRIKVEDVMVPDTYAPPEDDRISSGKTIP